jgi:internalin A
MPKGILARLIVKLSNDIFENKYWRYGVVLEYENTRALIKEKYFENKITIELSGTNKREFLFMIRKAINEIHNDFNKIKVNEMIPCKCSHCKNVDTPSFYDFDLLKRYELKNIPNIRCSLSLEEVNVFELTSDVIKSQLSSEKLVVCENKNAELLNLLKLENVIFYPERDSASVFIQINTKPDRFGLRDRDFLLDSEIEKIIKKYPNYYILEYYCFENYLFHPKNIQELKLSDFNIIDYQNEIIKQKKLKRDHIISNYKSARNNYQEFKIESDKLRNKTDEHIIINYLDSDEIEVFFKSFSMKDHFNKEMINKYNLKPNELSSTKWFKNKIMNVLNLN